MYYEWENDSFENGCVARYIVNVSVALLRGKCRFGAK
jgi:hypothetical protein